MPAAAATQADAKASSREPEAPSQSDGSSGDRASPRSSANAVDGGEAAGGSKSSSSNSNSGSSSPRSAISGGNELASDPAVGAAQDAAKPGKRQIKLRVLPPSEDGRRKEKAGFTATATPVASAAVDGAGEGREQAAEAMEEEESSLLDGSDSSSCVAERGKEAAAAAMGRLAGAQGAVDEAPNEDDGSDGPSPMDVPAPTASSAGSGSGYGSVAEGEECADEQTSGSAGSSFGAGEAADAAGEPSFFSAVARDEDGGTEGADEGSPNA